MAGGCLALDEQPRSPAASSPVALPSAGAGPRQPNQLIVAVPQDPEGFLPPGTDETTELLGDLLYDPLFRLDQSLTPVPSAAAALPQVSADGLSWSIDLRPAARFHDGSRVTAADAVLSLQMAASPSCPFLRDLCDAAATHLASATADEATGMRLTLTLRQPWAPFLAEVLGRLPLLSRAALTSAADAITAGASGLDATALRSRIERITQETNAERCLVASPPSGCRLADYADELVAPLRAAGAAIPPPERFATADGAFDEEARSGSLLRSVDWLVTVLTADGVDRLAAALPIVDVTRSPLGGGPFRLEAYTPGKELDLRAHPGHVPAARLVGVRLTVVRDPSVAATALRAGDVDWVLALDAEAATSLGSDQLVRVAPRPLPSVASIIFNVREGRAFADPVTRRAFVTCLDRATLVAALTGGVGVAAPFETAPSSWAFSGVAPTAPPDRAEVERWLQDGGWTRGSDGIFARHGKRLSSQVFVRPGREDLVALGRQAGDRLRDCGIELVVQELDEAGELLLQQLRWPNEFETVLVSRALGVDPDNDMAAFESVNATSAEEPAGANPGGYRSSVVDDLLARGRATTAMAQRVDLYAQVASQFVLDPPSLPIWYELAFAAVSARLRRGTQAVDPAAPRYAWDAWTWELEEG